MSLVGEGTAHEGRFSHMGTSTFDADDMGSGEEIANAVQWWRKPWRVGGREPCQAQEELYPDRHRAVSGQTQPGAPALRKLLL